MSDERPSKILGALPRSRPHRRSQKRPVRGGPEAAAPPQSGSKTRPEAMPTTTRAERVSASTRSKARPTARRTKPRAARPAQSKRLRQPAQPAGTPPPPRSRRPAPSPGRDILGTAVQATAELAEIGLTVSARALRNALSRLPRP